MPEREEQLDEVLTPQQRLKRALIARRTAKRRAIARKRKAKHRKSESALKAKARKQARREIASRFLQGKSMSDLPLSARAHIEKRINARKGRIDKMARKLFPSVRQGENERLRNIGTMKEETKKAPLRSLLYARPLVENTNIEEARVSRIVKSLMKPVPTDVHNPDRPMKPSAGDIEAKRREAEKKKKASVKEQLDFTNALILALGEAKLNMKNNSKNSSLQSKNPMKNTAVKRKLTGGIDVRRVGDEGY
jgi:hypothetical protein